MSSNRIPIRSIIEKLDCYLNQEDYQSADRLLRYWKNEAISIGDSKGELEILNEILGFSRRMNDSEGGLSAVRRSIELIGRIQLPEITAGTILLNAATTLKCFGKPEEAIERYEDAKRRFDGSLPQKDKLWGGFYNNYALALSDVGRFEDALDHYQNAIDVMMQNEHGTLEVAITLMNIAELFERLGNYEQLIEQNLEQALYYLDDPALPRNGYYAFVCRKCAPTFGHFGWFKTERDLNERADRIYEGNQ